MLQYIPVFLLDMHMFFSPFFFKLRLYRTYCSRTHISAYLCPMFTAGYCCDGPIFLNRVDADVEFKEEGGIRSRSE